MAPGITPNSQAHKLRRRQERAVKGPPGCGGAGRDVGRVFDLFGDLHALLHHDPATLAADFVEDQFGEVGEFDGVTLGFGEDFSEDFSDGGVYVYGGGCGTVDG